MRPNSLWIKAGYEGVIYPSYFTRVRGEPSLNLTVFGRPLAAGVLRVSCIDRVLFQGVRYDYRFGPAAFD